jgi:hypothetical protein
MGEGTDGRGRRLRRLRGEYFPESSIQRPARLGQGFGARTGAGRRAGRDRADADERIDDGGVAGVRGGVDDNDLDDDLDDDFDGRLADRFDGRPADRFDDRLDRGALDDEVDEEIGSAHELWGPLQWKDPSDFLPAELLTEFSDRASRVHAVVGRAAVGRAAVGRARDDLVEERRETPEGPRRQRQRRIVGDRTPSSAVPVVTGTPAYGVPPSVPPSVPIAACDIAAVPDDSRFSLSSIRTSSLLLAATALVVLGVAAHWASNGSDDEWSPSSSGRKAAASPYSSARPSAAAGTRSEALSADGPAGVGGRPVRKPTVVPSSACHRFVETSGRFDSVTVSVQNACQ